MTSTGTKYFQRNVNIPYDLYMNNCQTFVTSVAYEICSNKFPEDRLISIPIHHVLSYTAARFYTALAVPFMRFWYRCRGCDLHTLVEFERVSAFWGYWFLPMVLQQPIVVFPAIITEFRKGLEETGDDKPLPKSMRYLIAVFTSFWMFGFILSQPLLMAWVSQPRVKKYSDGKWRLQYRPNKVPTMDAGGVMKFEEMGSEEAVPTDSGNLITEDGRFLDSEKLVIPSWFWAVSGVSGFVLVCLYWSYRLCRRLLLLLLSTFGLGMNVE
jgi:hypothetical protein